MTTKLILQLKIYKSPTANDIKSYGVFDRADYYIEEKSNGSFSLNFFVNPYLNFTQDGQEIEGIVIDFPSKDEAEKYVWKFSSLRESSKENEEYKWIGLTFDEAQSRTGIANVRKSLIIEKGANLKQVEISSWIPWMTFGYGYSDPASLTFEIDNPELIEKDNNSNPIINVKPYRLAPPGVRGPIIKDVKIYQDHHYKGEHKIKDIFFNQDGSRNVDIKAGNQFTVNIDGSSNSWKFLHEEGVLLLYAENLSGLSPQKVSSNNSASTVGQETEQNNSNQGSFNQNQGNQNTVSVIPNIEEYNSLYLHGSHPTIVKFSQLHAQIHDNYNKYKDHSLMKQVNEKDADSIVGAQFRSVWNSDNEAKRQEIKNFNDNKLAKMSEMISLMERLIDEVKQNGSSPSSKQPGSEEKPVVNDGLKTVREEAIQSINKALNQEPKISSSDLDQSTVNWHNQIQYAENTNQINIVKAKVLADIRNKRAEKQRGLELENDFQNAENGTSEQIKDVIKKAEKEIGNENYRKNETKVKEFKSKLAVNSPDDYRKLVIELVTESMRETGLIEEDLDHETKSKYRKILNNEKQNISIEELEALEPEVNQAVQKTGWVSWVKKQLKKGEEWIKKAEKEFTKEVKQNLEKIRSDLWDLSISKNDYKSYAYQENEKEIKQMLSKLENSDFQNKNAQSPKTPWGTIISISVVAITLIVVLGVIAVRIRRRKIKQ